MICPKCRGKAAMKKIATQFFVLCLGACAGGSAEGSPITHGHEVEADSIAEYHKEWEREKN